jgi:hypothetical protein
MPQNMQQPALESDAIVPSGAPSTARELRAQAVHRLQVGLLGLCAMLLLVGLANIILDRARQTDLEEAPAAPAGIPAEAGQAGTDPLAEIGVVPAADPDATSTPAPSAKSGR